MAPFSANRHRDFSAGDVKKEWELGDWRSVPPLSLDDLFDDPAITPVRRQVDWQSRPARFLIKARQSFIPAHLLHWLVFALDTLAIELSENIPKKPRLFWAMM